MSGQVWSPGLGGHAPACAADRLSPYPDSGRSLGCPAQALTLPLLTMEEKVRTSSSSMAVPTADLAAPGPHASLWAPMTT